MNTPIYNLTIVNPKTGTTEVSLLSSQLPLTKYEMVELAKKAIKNGYKARVWDLGEWEPVFAG